MTPIWAVAVDDIPNKRRGKNVKDSRADFDKRIGMN
jgi:hypothetical protein